MGKSTCGTMLQECGVPVHESDKAVHDLLAAGGAGETPVLNAFPDLTAPIDRKALGAIIFNDDQKRELLESILHPLVQDTQKVFIAEHHDKNIVALDIPLLFETGAEERVDVTIVASAPADIQAQRVLARPNMTEEKFQNILARQMPDKDKRAKADYIVETGKGFDHARKQIQEIVEDLKKNQ